MVLPARARAHLQELARGRIVDDHLSIGVYLALEAAAAAAIAHRLPTSAVEQERPYGLEGMHGVSIARLQGHG